MPEPITVEKSDLNLIFPELEAPLKEPQTPSPTWEQWMMETAERTRYFLKNKDYREDRRHNEAEERFVL